MHARHKYTTEEGRRKTQTPIPLPLIGLGGHPLKINSCKYVIKHLRKAQNVIQRLHSPRRNTQWLISHHSQWITRNIHIIIYGIRNIVLRLLGRSLCAETKKKKQLKKLVKGSRRHRNRAISNRGRAHTNLGFTYCKRVLYSE